MRKRIKINPAYDSLKDYIVALPSLFEEEGATIYSGRNTIKRLLAPNGEILVVKRFGRLSLFRRLIYSTIARSKARRAFENGNSFLSLGFDTPQPVAYIEIYSRGLLKDAYFVSLKSDYSPMFEALVESERFDNELADDVAMLMAQLHAAGAIHGDPNLNNILYHRDDDGRVKMTLIDTNRSRFGNRLSTRRCLRNLMRVSHRRDLMRQIVGRYATLRGLDPVKTVERVYGMLDRFERNRALRHKVKDWANSLLRRNSPKVKF